MAAGSGAASGHGARGSTAALEASLDRRFQGVSNTMESIQGLSSWCIENKKHHSIIVRYWMKWLKKSDTNHRLNLFYLANDVIQNCKRKNAIVFRSTFAEVLPNAAQLIKDGKVRKSVERIFTIWEERSVYPEEVITQFKIGLSKKEREKERQKEKEKEKEKEKKETPPPPVQASSKTALKSKIVAEFTPTTFIEQLSAYKRTVEEEEFREKQLAALRLDVCSTEALKRMKDKAGGNKFANDFEDGSQKLQEFVTFLEDELNSGPSLLEALGNSDIFYEMQYKEVKIVANAYNAFANRVASLKRKLDVLKSSMPGPEDSPIPSPSEDAPSPTGSDSPYLGAGANRAQLDPELDGKAMDEGELVKDNRDSEDMDMSDEEVDRPSVTVDDDKDKATPAVSKATKAGTPSKPSLVATPPKAPAATTPVTPTSATGQGTPSTPLGVNLANVDLGKISSILSSITSAMKNTAASPSARPSPGTPTTPSGQSAASKSAPTSPALASILSRVDITPEGILNALSKTHTPGFSSLLQSVTNSSSTPSNRSSPESSSSSSKTPLTPTTPKSKAAVTGSSVKRSTPGRTRARENESQASSSSPPPPSPPAPLPCHSGSSASPPSLESKINSFLQGNPAFSLGLGDGSPLGGTDGVDGTPVRDEAAGTPTQDEIMDTPSGGHSLSPTAYRGADPWDAVITPSGGGGDFLASSTRYGDEARKRSSAPAKHKEDAGRKQQAPAVSLGDGAAKTTKGKKDGQAVERRAKAGSKEAGPGRYHRIQTLVSPCVQGERIQTVESIRVTGRGSRPGAGGRPGGMWYEEEEYMEAPPPSPRPAAPPPLGQAAPEDMLPSRAAPPPLPPPPHLLPLPHLHPPPPLSPFQMPYHGEGLQTPLPLHHHHRQHPPPASFFSAPPIPRPPPPPMPQRPLHPHGFPRVPSVVMVGGVLVPVDRPLPPIPLPVRLDGPRGGKAALPPLMTSLLGEPPKLPRPGTVKEPFLPRHVLPLHRPGAPGAPPSLLGRVKEPLSRPPPSPSPTSSAASSSTPSSPAADAASRPPGPPQSPAASPPAQPRSQTPSPRGHPVPLLRLPILPTPPVPQRPPLRGRAPKFSQDAGGFRGGKRPAPAFTGGPFHAPKRPFLPPRY